MIWQVAKTGMVCFRVLSINRPQRHLGHPERGHILDNSPKASTLGWKENSNSLFKGQLTKNCCGILEKSYIHTCIHAYMQAYMCIGKM